MTRLFLHGFGVRYDLPISLPLYLLAAGAVVLLSFVLVALFASEKEGEEAIRYPRWQAPWLEAMAAARWPLWVTRSIGVVALLATIVIGLFGSQSATLNAAEYVVWIFFWAGLVILSGLLGNLYSLFNPFLALFDLLARGAKPLRKLPPALGIWPAALGYFLFACLELTSGYAAVPRAVAASALLYTAVTLVGMTAYGRDEWMYRADPFGVLFSIVSRFGPIEVEGSGARRHFYLRPWGVGLLQPSPSGWDRVVFVILMLASLAFDGIVATPFWNSLNTAATPVYSGLGALGFALFRTLGFVSLTLLFLAVFVVVMRFVILLGGGAATRETVTLFAYTLVPIALVYNAAHNYSYLVVQAQGIFPALADPLGHGTHIYSANGFQPSFLLAGAAVVWYLQIVLIVLGHVIAVYLAHLRAEERFADVRAALLSEYPMLALMILYTMTSLWILAQPITRSAG